MTCFIVRWQLSSELDGDGERRPSVARHLESCEQCRAYATRLYALHDRLAVAAPKAPRATLPRPAMVWPALAAAAMAAVLVATLAWPRAHHDAPVAAMIDNAPAAVTSAPAVAAIGPALASRSRSLAGKLAGLAAADPLRVELAALKRDALHGANAAAQIAGLRFD